MSLDAFVHYHRSCVSYWLIQGWSYFLKSWWISISFSSIFVFIGGFLAWMMLKQELGLMIYPLLSGFVIIAPVLVTGFQRIARQIHENKDFGFADLFIGIREGTRGVWFLSFILGVCYVIWITDAMIIYGLFFGVKAIPIDMNLVIDSALKEQLISYLLFSGMMGLVIAIMGFAISAFSIQLIMHNGNSFVSAIATSTSTVLKHKWLMLRWALTLATCILATLLLALPLLVIVLPVMAYASYAAYVDLLETNKSLENHDKN